MAVSDSTSMRPPYPAREYVLSGTPLDVVHMDGGKPVTRVAIVDISPTTFLERGGARKVSSATATFLQHVAVRLEDTVTLPNEETPRKVLRVTSRFGLTVATDGRLTTVLLR